MTDSNKKLRFFMGMADKPQPRKFIPCSQCEFASTCKTHEYYPTTKKGCYVSEEIIQ